MALDVESMAIPDVRLVTPRRFSDSRGFFSETYNERVFNDAGINARFVQDNHSYSAERHTVRGLHYQAPPFAQAKLFRVLRGAVLDVAVDVRKESPTYGRWVSAMLSAENGKQIFVPHGFLHGFVTLQAHTEVAYRVDAYYSKTSDGAVLWNDPDLAIDWGIEPNRAILSDKDTTATAFRDFSSPF